MRNVIAGPKERKTRFCFAEIHDIILLKEVLGENGLFQKISTYQSKTQIWQLIAQNINKHGVHVDSHRAKLRLHRLVQLHEQDENNQMRFLSDSIGTKEEEHTAEDQHVSEKKVLLRRYCALRNALQASNQKRPNIELNNHEDFAVANGHCERNSPEQSFLKARKPRFCFSEEHDLIVLKEVLQHSELFQPNGVHRQQIWQSISDNVIKQGVNVSGYRVRLRLQRLVELHEQEINKTLSIIGSSGTCAEDTTEKKQLLQQYCDRLRAVSLPDKEDGRKRSSSTVDLDPSGQMAMDHDTDKFEALASEQQDNEILETSVRPPTSLQNEILAIKRKKMQHTLEFQKQSIALQSKTLEAQTKLLQFLEKVLKG
uniref:AlNc14C210G8911 protein n=1 Tax=Albugo laibachii Nc14 TaxID=890382 RepID=F0WRA4_9STRA|nr:AlNc14C210G8911 [Albugo laibachii Nc14]CCA24051.1 AlNc14C219G9080 [Albugo laibachii Nc14]|eukprot:CCA24051.1 AlNc14C219G9080 [Albugo laibachii Nc14]